MSKQTFKIISRRKVTLLSAAFFSVFFFCFSCKKKDSDIGESLQSESLDVQKIDTFTVLTYSEEVDSMESDETALNLLGAYVDPVFGKVECGVVTQVLPSSLNPDLGTSSTTVVDSVVLQLRYADLLKYGTLSDLTFEVYEITDDLERDNTTYYTFQTPNHTGTNLVLSGSETQTPDPYSLVVSGDDTLSAHLRIPLETSVGDEFIADNEAGQISSEDTWVNNFKGLYIRVDASSLTESQGSVLYLSLEDPISELTVYFHDSGTMEEGEYSFLINSNAARYNEMKFDRTGTHVEDVLTDPSEGQETFYTQAGAIWGVVEFPHIMDFNYDSLGNEDPKIINRAELYLPVQDYTPSPYNPVRSLFIARIVDGNTSTFTVDYNIGSSFDGSNTVGYDTENKEFRFIVTRELQSILTGGKENVGYRIYPPNFFASSVERVIFNGPGSPLKERPRLEITYTDY